MLCTRFYTAFCFLLYIRFHITYSFSYSSSYDKHCASIVPAADATARFYGHYPLVQLSTIYYDGGNKLLGRRSTNKQYIYVGKSLSFHTTSNVYETTASGVYKIHAYLNLRSPYREYYSYSRNYTYGSFYHRSTRRTGFYSFVLDGFYSESTGRMCMVGSAPWYNGGEKTPNLYAVLKLNYAGGNATMVNSVVSGSLESLNSPDDSAYFEPISIYAFPPFSNYSYTLVSRELDGGVTDDTYVQVKQSMSLEPGMFCFTASLQGNTFELAYAKGCRMALNCTPFSEGFGYSPHFMYLRSIQCSRNEEKARYMIEFRNSSKSGYFDDFGPHTTLVGEGSWDSKANRLLIVGCKISQQPGDSGSSVGDCTTRMSLWFPTIWNIRNTDNIVGEIWTNKTVNDSGYFSKIMFRSTPRNNMNYQGLKYEFTELDRVKKLCPVKRITKKKGRKYPDGHSDMRFDMSVTRSKEYIGWGMAEPIFVGNELYRQYSSPFLLESRQANVSDTGTGTISEAEKKSYGSMNISYKISFKPRLQSNRSLLLSSSQNPLGPMDITAEGVYNAETGHLCMVGCRKLDSGIQKPANATLDCEILVVIEFSPVSARRGSVIKGSIRSTRKKEDPLHFKELSFSSYAYYTAMAKKDIWRMDLEIAMALISNTLTCIFVGLQLFHVKRNPQVLPSISLVMLLILSLGHMIPLVLNFEALFSRNLNMQIILRRTGGWFEANEVTVRVITMVAFLLQIRLLQLSWASRSNTKNVKNLWAAEMKSTLISLPIYILGALLTLLMNRMRSTRGHQTYSNHGSVILHRQVPLWMDFRSYAGLIIDTFLFPQILLNMFWISRENTLSRWFYCGTALVRLLPHAYDLFRLHKYMSNYLDGSYYYANHRGDFYSTAWDVIIPCGGIALVVTIYIQQRFGGRCILPQRFRGTEQYEKVPVVETE